MPALDFILPAPQGGARALADGGHLVASQTQPQAAAKPFDDLMNRALSPDSQKADATTSDKKDADASGDTSSGPATGKKNKLGSVDLSNAAVQLITPFGTPLPGVRITMPTSSEATMGADKAVHDPGVPAAEVNGGVNGKAMPVRSGPPAEAGEVAPIATKVLAALAETAPAGSTTANGSSPKYSADKSGTTPVATPELKRAQNGASLELAAGKQASPRSADCSQSAAVGFLEALRVGTTRASATDQAPPSTPAAGDSASIERQVTSDGNLRHPSRATLHTPTATLPSDGTSVAKLDATMKNAEKMNKVAGPAEKVLPGNVISLAQEKNLPVRATTAPVSPRDPKSETVLNLGPAMTGSAPTGAAPAADAAAVSSIIDLRVRAVERTHDMMAMQATRLSDAGLSSLHVVIKPGAGMQLSLELRQHGDGIDARAVLQRGDFNYLSQHWPELQQRLEQRGVRLAPLSGQENAAANPEMRFAAGSGQNGFQQQQQQRQPDEQDLLFASAFAEFALAGAAAPAHAASTKPRSWETWA